MTMEQLVKDVCWKRTLVPHVMNTEALQLQPQYFLATHTPMQMHRVDEQRVGKLIDQQEFRELFLDPSREHVQAVVMGEAGTGKSHLVRWLYFTIEATPNRHIVMVPKIGANLKGILQLILKGMGGTNFDEYRNRLARATDSLTMASARDRLLDELAIATGPDGPVSKEVLSGRDEMEMRDYLMASLPDLLRDPPFRKFLSRPNGIIDELAHHVIGTKDEYERLQEPRHLRGEDFDLENAGLRPDQINANARAFFAYLLADPRAREDVVAWINANLSWSLTRVLDMSRDDLMMLLAEVRRSLGAEGKELILLIEDFAKLQGIDYALLDALGVQPVQDDKRLCPIRSLIAVTTGYYRDFYATVANRITLAVTLDIERQSGDNSPRGSVELARFAAKYLNAVRLNADELRYWHERGDFNADIPNACEPCDFRETCHPTFGARDQLGLYPFTPAALNRMYSLAAGSDAGRFNPRRFINKVLVPILDHYEPLLAQRRFPPEQLAADLGARFPAAAEQELQQRAPGNSAGRWKSLVSLWGEPDNLDSVSAEIARAFHLPPLSGERRAPSPPSLEPHSIERVLGHPKRLADQLACLDRWNQVDRLDAAVAQELRDHLYTALQDAIDWDTEMLVRTDFSGATKAFRRDGIHFRRPSTGPRRVPILLELPLREEKWLKTTLALQGALCFAHYGHWNFANGREYLRHYLWLLRDTGAEVLKRVRRLADEPQDWSPAPAAAELLTIGAMMAGWPKASKDTIEYDVDALFLNWTSLGPNAARSREWNTLFRVFLTRGEDLAKILRSRIGCTKGGASGAQIIDAELVLKTVRRVHRTWAQEENIPDTVRKDYEVIRTVRMAVDTYLFDAIMAESARVNTWLARVNEHLGGTTASDISRVIKATRNKVREAGVWPGAVNEMEFDTALSSFERSGFDDGRRQVSDLLAEADPHGRLKALGRNNFERALTSSDRLIQITERLVNNASTRIAQREGTYAGTGAGAKELCRQIGDGLTDLFEITRELANGAMSERIVPDTDEEPTH